MARTATHADAALERRGPFVHIVLPLGLLLLYLIAATVVVLVVLYFIGRAVSQGFELVSRRLQVPTEANERQTYLIVGAVAATLVLMAGVGYVLIGLVRDLRKRPLREALIRALLKWIPWVGVPAIVFSIGIACVAYTHKTPQLWWGVLIPFLMLAIAFNVWMYVRDTKSVSWPWAIFLMSCRVGVFLGLAFAFLQPSLRSWETTEKRSRVVVLIDISDSVLKVSDDRPSPDRPADKLETRFEKVLRMLTDQDVAFLSRLLDKNPVVVYRFGSRLDEDFSLIAQGQPAWGRDEWTAWARMDFKTWLTQGVSDGGKAVLRDHPEFGDGPGNSEWALAWAKMDETKAIPAVTAPDQPAPRFTAEDRQKLLDRREKLEKRVDVVRQLVQGTNVGDSLLGAINREANNMLQGVVVISDGRGNLGSESAVVELRARAVREQIPIFAIVVGEDRQTVSIQITDVQTPQQAPPNEKFVIRAEIDGVGLPGRDKPVFLDVFRPSEDPKKAKPALTLEGKVLFAPGEPPHGQAEFAIDPTEETDLKIKLPDDLLKPKDQTAGKRELLEGEWRFVVRIPKDENEAFVGAEHLADPVSVTIIKKPLRVLMFASGPTKDFQFIKTMLVREKDMKRAELSVFLQNEGRNGPDQLDVDPERRLLTFPSFMRVDDVPKEDPKQKYYNLALYDVILAFDPDWNELQEEQIKMIRDWMDNQGGGLVIVGGPVHTFQLARAEEGGRLKALLEIFPVIPGDSVLPVNPQLGIRRDTKNPWFLNFKGATREMDYLKLDDNDTDPLAGWDQFFFRKPRRDEKDVAARRGFHSFYPVNDVKRGATVVATFPDPKARLANGDEHPFIVDMKYGKGRTIFLGSGEMWRLRGFKEEYYERFWTKLARYASSGSRLRQDRRGVLVMGRQFTSGNFVRFEAQMFDSGLKPLAEGTDVKAFLVLPGPEETRKEIKLSAKKTSVTWSGWFQGRTLVEQPGDYRLEIPIPNSGEVLRQKFVVKESNPELDFVRPDPAALYAMAGRLDEIQARFRDRAAYESLRDKLSARRVTTDKAPSDAEAGKGDSPRLFFDLQSARAIPDCMDAETKVQRSRGPERDIWDYGPRLGRDNMNMEIRPGWLLWLLVLLLSTEWLCRKLLRLA